MGKNTHTVSGGAMPKSNRAAIIARAWSIFRIVYKYPSIKFSSIGWKCFGSCVHHAWVEAKAAAEVAAIPKRVKTKRIKALKQTIARAPLAESWAHASHEMNLARAEIARLSA